MRRMRQNQGAECILYVYRILYARHRIRSYTLSILYWISRIAFDPGYSNSMGTTERSLKPQAKWDTEDNFVYI